MRKSVKKRWVLSASICGLLGADVVERDLRGNLSAFYLTSDDFSLHTTGRCLKIESEADVSVHSARVFLSGSPLLGGAPS